MKPKIVVDTSVFISALIGPTGPAREVIRRSLRGDYRPLMGNALFTEYESVIGREEIKARCPLTEEETRELFAAFITACRWVSVYYLWRPNLKDEADNHLIELAIAGNARIIVTHNTRDFQNTELLFPDLSIVKPENLIQS
jgi:putative PIN family toxin of toxin-antitoxin system